MERRLHPARDAEAEAGKHKPFIPKGSIRETG
jgi:hypothetical protein